MMQGWMDTHCHLCLLKAEQGTTDNVVNRAREHGVGRILDVSTGPDNWACVMSNTQQFETVYGAVGIHPTSETQDIDWALLAQYAADERVIAIGECGLDFYHEPEADCQHQYERFERQITLAKTVNKPLIIHTRNSSAQTLAVLKAQGAEQVSGIMHCFVEDEIIAQQALDLGFYISFSGISTFKNAELVKRVAAWVPLDRLLIETDSPYLAPVPHRGKQNEPAFVSHVGQALAQLRGISEEALMTQLHHNAKRLFRFA